MSSVTSHRLSFIEKSGYAMGDAAANLVWRGALAYLAVFYTDTLGISAAAAGLLLLLVRLSDGITDIIMGMVADRTHTKHGKFRPWILWSAPFLGLFMILAFTAPDVSPVLKIVWAYFTYIGLTLAYTINNVPYSALMGVMTPSHTERSVLSGYRFAGAFLGGALVMGFTPFFVSYFGQGNSAQGYQYTMYMFAALLVVMCMITFFTTKERVSPVQEDNVGSYTEMLKNMLFMVIPLGSMSWFFVQRNVTSGLVFIGVLIATAVVIRKLINLPEDKRSPTQRDIIDLITNGPWLMVLGLGLFTMFFNGIRYTTVSYYFTYIMGDGLLAGKFFFVILVTSIFAAFIAGYLTEWLGKKALFAISLLASGLLTCCIYFIQPGQVNTIMVLGVAAEFFAAFMPVLTFSMLGDAADFSEWKHGRRATGLFYSAGTFIQKMGNGFAAALVLLVLAAYGYVGTDPSTIEQSKPGMIALMSWVPSLFAFAALGLLVFYPLNTQRMEEIESDLQTRRAKAQ